LIGADPFRACAVLALRCRRHPPSTL